VTTAADRIGDRIAAPGTGEADWAPWLATRQWPAWQPDPAWQRVAVVAAHPDDEVLGAAGAMLQLAAAGVAVQLVVVTDGEASHPGSTVLTPGELAGRRVGETRAALAVLGLSTAGVTRLGLPDSGVAAHGDELVRLVTSAVTGADALLSVWSHDAHPDHEATGRAAVAAGRELGVPVWQFPVWTWHWAEPDDPRVPWADAVRVALPTAARAAKRAAVATFVTQVHPLGPDPADAAVLSPGFLAHFDRDSEVLFR